MLPPHIVKDACASISGPIGDTERSTAGVSCQSTTNAVPFRGRIWRASIASEASRST
jgi:hypothetical protein